MDPRSARRHCWQPVAGWCQAHLRVLAAGILALVHAAHCLVQALEAGFDLAGEGIHVG